MKVGTKSVLFGAHCFIIHPVFVLIAWIKLYGFPFDPRLWIAFFVHDLGYWGKPNMDGKEGETHVELGARILSNFDYRVRVLSIRKLYMDYPGYKVLFVFNGYVLAKSSIKEWENFSRYHSRFYAKKDRQPYSKLCVADKLAIALEPYWLYLPRVILSGEIKEYMKLAKAKKYEGEPISKYESMRLSTKSRLDWFRAMTSYLTRWVEEHKDGRDDTWTPEIKTAIDANGTYQ